jgi:hypothetical protein
VFFVFDEARLKCWVGSKLFTDVCKDLLPLFHTQYKFIACELLLSTGVSIP